MSPEPPHRSAGSARFATTHWSVVLAAGRPGTPDAQEALATLCQTYWYPLYVFIRRQGHNAEDAQDLTQEFFARLLEKDYLRLADANRGKFRSFLLAACKHFLAKERDRACALKRGGGRPPLPLDFQAGETRYCLEPAHDWTADRIFERRWTLTLLDQVLSQLQDEYVQAGKGRVFDRLKGYLTGEKGGPPYAQVAAELDLTEGAVKVAVHRLRQRYRELLRAAIGHTVADSADIEDELHQLFLAVRSSRS
jgi:RNA polymerase sigma-70 factor (ECF subfamily)